MNSGRYILLAIVVVVGLAWFFLFESDEEKILGILDSIVQEGALVTEEHPFERLAKAKKLSDTCAQSVSGVLHFADEDHNIVANQKELIQKIALARSHFTRMTLRHQDAKVSAQGNTAQVTFLGIAHGLLKDGSEFRESMPLVFHFEKIDGDWLITKGENEGVWPPDE